MCGGNPFVITEKDIEMTGNECGCLADAILVIGLLSIRLSIIPSPSNTVIRCGCAVRTYVVEIQHCNLSPTKSLGKIN